jgi:nitrogen fixation NifU-like protein
MSALDYSPMVLDHYENPRNVGEAEAANAVATVVSEGCGDRLRLSLRIGPGRVIEEARFRTFGCVAAIAASSMTTEMLLGLPLDRAGSITEARVTGALGGLPPGKAHGSVLAERAVRAALEDFEARRRPAGPGSGGGPG